MCRKLFIEDSTLPRLKHCGSTTLLPPSQSSAHARIRKSPPEQSFVVGADSTAREKVLV